MALKKVAFNRLIFLLAVLPIYILGQEPESQERKFKQWNDSENWTLRLSDTGTEDWKEHWFLDGEKATIVNSEHGMHLQAGPEQDNDAHHAVLWTKDSFEGAIKVTYEYTKTDTLDRNVTILYLQASGIGKEPFSKDIYEWKELRTIPKMSTYFKNMNAFHISYAAISRKEGNHYVRARRYPVTVEKSFNELMMPPTYDHESGTIKDGITYKITAIKTDEELLFQIEGDENAKIFFWRISSHQIIKEGRVGFRNMFGRNALYKNIQIYTSSDNRGAKSGN